MADSIAQLRKRLGAIVQNNKKEENQAPIVHVVQQSQSTAEAENSEIEKPKDENSIWVGNLDPSVTQEKLENHFTDCGKIKNLTIPTKQNPHAPKYAYIEFDSKETAQLAIDSLNNHLFCGRNLIIKPKSENSPGIEKQKLTKACEEGNIELIKSLIQNCTYIQVKSLDTPLICASRQGHLEVVNYLIFIGADKEAKDDDGDTPLICASRKGHLEVVEYLISVGADKEAKNNDGYTPLILASQNGHTEVVEYLISVGAGKTTMKSLCIGDSAPNEQNKKRTETFASNILKVIKQTHPDIDISNKAMMNSFAADICGRIAKEGARLIDMNKHNTPASHKVQTAVSEGGKTVAKFNAE